MTKPLIGLMSLWDDQKESLWMLPGYVDGIKNAGGLPVIFPFTEDEGELEQLCSMCSGFAIAIPVRCRTSFDGSS